MTQESAHAGHRPIDHTGDVAFELWAPSEEALLGQAARAATELMTGDPVVPSSTEREPREVRDKTPAAGTELREVRLQTLDREDRLVQWLNEVIYLAVCEGLLVRHADIALCDAPAGGQLVARVHADRLGPGALATELKSATYHDLCVEHDNGTWRARVVIDV